MKKSQSTQILYLLTLGPASWGGGGGSWSVMDTMRRNATSMAVILVVVSLFLLASFEIYSTRMHVPQMRYTSTCNQQEAVILHQQHPRVDDTHDDVYSVSILLPDWEVLVILPPSTRLPPRNYTCVYPNDDVSPATFSGILPSTNQTTFRCLFPPRNRRRLPFMSPALRPSSSENKSPVVARHMIRWSYLVYDSFSTEMDVVLFVKGVNNRQGINRSPHEFRCVFNYDGDDTGRNVVRTAVTSSIQEVFRCHHPDITELNNQTDHLIKVSLEITSQSNVGVPSVAYYMPRRLDKALASDRKSVLCASTMVYNVAKYLREWMMYHSKIGVEKFILYDNGSDDELKEVVEGLKREGYDVESLLWIWPKTQEAGFSHAALLAKQSCTWIMYLDVDEFVFSPSWIQSPHPSHHMLKSLLPKTTLQLNNSNRRLVGQVSIKCNEFGPSNQSSHPIQGVTQGYTCRRRADNRHKSIVLLDAIHFSLMNAVHHFKLIDNKYRSKQMSLEAAVVNHYKYQAWPEFKAKFRRRVSAYVVDWTHAVNPASKDRAPGLGFQAVQPPGWEKKFCEVTDERLKLLTQHWFGLETENGYIMAWQS